jgi:Protein of unknown function (DUF3738)
MQVLVRLREPLKPIALAMTFAALTLAQTRVLDKRAEFEVASICPATEHNSEDIDTNRGLPLDWAPVRLDSRPDPALDVRPSIFTGLQDRFGLKLESAEVPVQAIVIDRAQMPGEN